jgi:hypothetical protein
MAADRGRDLQEVRADGPTGVSVDSEGNGYVTEDRRS